mmetsp:Transcript_15543/g.35590  ORF Transcript_15543/g.35590 Transcript_15543/m.35590 type:complete len:221 (+) Transcript_15543:388-1050(+)
MKAPGRMRQCIRPRAMRTWLTKTASPSIQVIGGMKSLCSLALNMVGVEARKEKGQSLHMRMSILMVDRAFPTTNSLHLRTENTKMLLMPRMTVWMADPTTMNIALRTTRESERRPQGAQVMLQRKTMANLRAITSQAPGDLSMTTGSTRRGSLGQMTTSLPTSMRVAQATNRATKSMLLCPKAAHSGLAKSVHAKALAGMPAMEAIRTDALTAGRQRKTS